MKLFKKNKIVLIEEDVIYFARKKGKNIIVENEKLSEGTIDPNPFKENVFGEELKEKLKELKSKTGIEGKVDLLLPGGASFITVIDLPELPEDSQERRRMVSFYMEKRFPRKGELFIAENKIGQRKVLVAVASKEALNSYTAPVKSSGLKPVSVKPSSISALNYLLERETNASFILIFFLLRRIIFIGVKDGNPVVYRTLRSPYTEEEASEELRIVKKFMGNKVKLFGCGENIPEWEGLEKSEKDCFSMMIEGELC